MKRQNSAAPAKSVLKVKVESPNVKQAPSAKAAAPRAYTWRNRFRSALLSDYCQSGLQIAAGFFVACLFTFVRPIAFPQSCVVATYFLVVAVMASPTNHLGTKINTAASLVGSVWIGVLLAAIVGTFSKLAGPGAPATATLCVLGPAVLAVLAINRVSTAPPTLWALGMVTCLAFGLTSILTWRIWPISEVWRIAGHIILCAVIAGFIAVLVAALVAPMHASHDVQNIVSDVMRSAGVATSRYSARLFRPVQGSTATYAGNANSAAADSATGAAVASNNGTDSEAGTAAAAVGKLQGANSSGTTLQVYTQMDRFDSLYSLGDAGLAFVLEEPLTDKEWLAIIQRNSSPNPTSNPTGYACPIPQQPPGALRPKLAMLTNLLLPAVAVEPHLLREGFSQGSKGWMNPLAWGKVATTLQLLITRLSALEAVVEDGESLNDASIIACQDLLQRLRLVYSQAATSLAFMAHTVKVYGGHLDIATNNPFSSCWADTVAAVRPSKSNEAPFCDVVVAFGRSWAEAKADLAYFMQINAERYWQTVLTAEPGSPVALPALTQVRHLMYTWCLSNGIIDTVDQLEKAVAAAVCSAPPTSLWERLGGWLLPLLPLLSGQYVFGNIAKVLGHELPAAVREGKPGIRRMLASPRFQAGCKYWLVLAVVFVATVLSLHFDAVIASLSPAFGFVAAALAMSERVEATVSKVSFWVLGTIAGGALGFLVMYDPSVATNPYIMMVILVTAAFLVGTLGPTRARVAVTLTLMTLSAIVLCQCCGHVGQANVAIARVVSVLGGALFSVFICNAIYPWYTSSWAIETLAATYKRSISIMSQMYAKYYADDAAAVAKFEVQCPAIPQAGFSHQQGLGTEGLINIRHSATDVAAAHEAAATVAAAAAASSAAVGGVAAATGAAGSAGTSNEVCNPVMLQMQVARPLVEVQGSLIRDTVAWSRGVLATPPVVPRALSLQLALLDRLAALQLAVAPPDIRGHYTGTAFLNYSLPMRPKVVRILELMTKLADATAAVLLDPSSENAVAVKTIINDIEQHRVIMYKLMLKLRKQMHVQLEEQRHVVALTLHQHLQLKQQRDLQLQQLQGGDAHPSINQQLLHQALQQLDQALGEESDTLGTDHKSLPHPGEDNTAASRTLNVGDKSILSPESDEWQTTHRRVIMLLGGVDDVVRFMSFQFAMIKAVDKATAVAKLAVSESCRARNNASSVLK